jgi:hypothetical protein
MTALSQSTKRKLSLLQLAAELDNVSKACQIMGYHRDSFYEIKRAFQKQLFWKVARMFIFRFNQDSRPDPRPPR